MSGRAWDQWGEWLEEYEERRRERVRQLAERGESQPLWNEALRVLYITAAIAVNGLVLTEVLVRLEAWWRWPLFLALLAVAAWAEYRVYRRFWPEGWAG